MKFEFREILPSKLSLIEDRAQAKVKGAVLVAQGHQPGQESASPYTARLDSPSSEPSAHSQSGWMDGKKCKKEDSAVGQAPSGAGKLL